MYTAQDKTHPSGDGVEESGTGATFSQKSGSNLKAAKEREDLCAMAQ
jgi:hypothetical protein